MKIFAIRDENDSSNKNLAYLLYYEREKRFYIELPEDADVWETPLILDSFVKRGERSVNEYYSKLWVQQRIVPTDRQNIGQVLKANGLNVYDEYALLTLADGRCAQDDYYIEELSEEELPEEFVARYAHRIEDVVPLGKHKLLVFFRDGLVKKCDVRTLFMSDRRFLPVLNSEDIFKKVNVEVGGHGICWGESLCITCEKLYNMGRAVPLCMEDFCSFVETRVVNTAEAAEILDCTRQNIDDLIKRDKLHPIKVDAKNKLFLKTEILQRKWI